MIECSECGTTYSGCTEPGVVPRWAWREARMSGWLTAFATLCPDCWPKGKITDEGVELSHGDV